MLYAICHLVDNVGTFLLVLLYSVPKFLDHIQIQPFLSDKTCTQTVCNRNMLLSTVLLFNIPVNTFSVILGQNYCFHGIYQFY